MVLTLIMGDLGGGKTLTMTYLMYRNHIRRNAKIYSNYKIKGVPYTYVNTLEELKAMVKGFAFLDELWLWVDSRTHRSKKNREIDHIIAMSRKRGINIFFTARNPHRVDVRLREHLDFVIRPTLSKYVSVKDVDTMVPLLCTIQWFVFPDGYAMGKVAKMHRFYTPPIMEMYNTYEEINRLED